MLKKDVKMLTLFMISRMIYNIMKGAYPISFLQGFTAIFLLLTVKNIIFELISYLCKIFNFWISYKILYLLCNQYFRFNVKYL